MTELLFLRWRSFGAGERACVLVLLAALVAWALVPPIAQDPRYHVFADQRTWLGVEHASDVLSNVVFLAVGSLGIARLASAQRTRFSAATEAALWCVALGLVATAVGSAWYHVDPTDATLAWDRLPMTLIFTGILATALAQRIGDDVARVALAVMFELGVASVVYWRVSGDLSLYVTLQVGGIVALLLLALLARGEHDPFRWWWLLAWYALAKLAEAGDRIVWDATAGLVAGHALKHLFAAVATLAMFRPLHAQRRGASAAAAAAAPRTSDPV